MLISCFINFGCRCLMYKKHYLNIIFIFSLLFGHSAYAANGSCGLYSCKPECIESKLLDLGLNTKIKNNADLLDDIKSEYGQILVDQLTKEHPFLLKIPDGKIDKKTLTWVKKIGFSNKFSPGQRYLLIPFNEEINSYGVESFLDAILPEAYPILKGIPIFLSKEQLNIMEQAFISNNYQDVISHLTTIENVKIGSKLKIAKGIYKKIFTEKNYIIGNEIKKLSGHRIRIIGHGLPGTEYITANMYVDAHEVHYSDVVNILKTIGLPGDVNITLLSCFSGNGESSVNTNKTENELISLFINDNLDTVIGNKTNSYAYKFSKEIYNTWPQFNGHVTGYIGDYVNNRVLAYTKDSSNVITTQLMYSVGLFDINKKPIDFDRSEMMIKYTKRDFIISPTP